MAGEGFVGLAVDEEADLLDLREVGVERADDGEQGEGFDLDAGGVGVDEAAVEVDDGEFAAGAGGLEGVGVGGARRGWWRARCRRWRWRWCRSAWPVMGRATRKTSSTAAPDCSGCGGAGEGVLGDEVLEEGAGAGGGFGGQRDLALGGGDGAVGVVGEVEGDGFGDGVGGVDGGLVGEGVEAVAGALVLGEEEDAP